MKKNNLLIGLLTLALVVFGVSCNEKSDPVPSILPASFNIEVPSSLTNGGVKTGNAVFSGNEAYAMMRAFIYVGNASGFIIRDFMAFISLYHIDKPMDITFVSNDDLRTKNLVVTANQTFEGVTYEYKMVVTDISDPTHSAVGLEMYWNRSPVKGVSIMQFSNLNRRGATKDVNSKIRIDYSEASTAYDKTMEVTLVGLDTVGVNNNVDNLKMFVGKKGNLLDVYGNANIPDYQIIDKTHADGYNWAFVARSNEDLNISVAKVALPPCTLVDLTNIFEIYSLKDVLTQEINKQYPTLTPLEVAVFLANTGSPAYFNGTQGFLSCGTTLPTTPAGFTSSFADLSTLKPYIPYQIDALQVNFSGTGQ